MNRRNRRNGRNEVRFFLYGRYKTQVTQVRLNQRVFWVKDGLKMEFWGNGCV